MMRKDFIEIPMDLVFTREISPRAVMIYGLLAAMNQEDKTLSYDDLAAKFKMSAMSVRNCIKELEKQNLITIEKRGRNNFYKFT